MSTAPAAGRAGAALGVGALAGVLAAVPALVRLSSAGEGGSFAVLALTGGSALLLGPLLLFVDRAHAQGARLSILAWGLGLAVWPLATLGSLLERTTHHRPLGAATFVILALGVLLGSFLVARRVAALGSSWRRPLAWGLSAAAVASTGLVLLGALKVDAVRPHAMDGVLLVVGGALGWVVLRFPAVVNSLSRAGLVLWAAFVVGHLVALTRPSFDQVRDRAPVLAGPAAWL